MNKTLLTLSIIGALSLSACDRGPKHDGHMPPPNGSPAGPQAGQPAPNGQASMPPAMADLPSEMRTAGDLKIEVQGPWARATVAGQNMGGAFVNLTSDQDATLVGATSPVSEKVELHTMKMEGEKMVMAQVPNIPLPAKTKVELKPGSLHIMFMSLKAPLKEGDTVALKLEIKDKAGKSEFLDLQAPVKALGEPMPMKVTH